MFALLMTLTLSAAPADDLTGVWAAAPSEKNPSFRQVAVISRDDKGTTRVLWNQRFLYEVVKKGDAWEPTPEALKLAATLGEGVTLPKVYPLDGKKIGVGTDKPGFTRVPEVDGALRALAAKTVFTSAQSKDNRAELSASVFFSATLIEREKPRCVFGVLLPPLGGVEKMMDPLRPLPKGAKLKPLQLAWVGVGGVECGGAVPAAAKVADMNGGVILLVDAKGTPQAVQIIGYMYAEAFLRDGLDPALKKEVLGAEAEEIGKAAE